MKNNPIIYRHEMKYLISLAQLNMIRNQVGNMMRLDHHTNESGVYRIRSLYFDDYYNSCYYENENGTSPREKFRIRIYNHSTEKIMLECKRKENGKIHKTSCPLTIEQTRELMEGRYLTDIGNQPELLQKFTYLMMTRKYKPSVIVEYDRIPYVYKLGNVRVTLDYNICSSRDFIHFLDKDIQKRPIMSVGQQLLEVKYDEFLPQYIYNNLQLKNMRQITYSKYYLCRKITL